MEACLIARVTRLQAIDAMHHSSGAFDLGAAVRTAPQAGYRLQCQLRFILLVVVLCG